MALGARFAFGSAVAGWVAAVFGVVFFALVFADPFLDSAESAAAAFTVRFGLDGTMIDLDRAEEFPARDAIERLLAWSAPVRAELGLDPSFPERNGAQRQQALIAAGASREEVFATSVAETRQSYAQEVRV